MLTRVQSSLISRALLSQNERKPSPPKEIVWFTAQYACSSRGLISPAWCGINFRQCLWSHPDKSLLKTGCHCAEMICKINPLLYLQSSNHSPAVLFPNPSIIPGKCGMLENKAQINFYKACFSRQHPVEWSTKHAIVYPVKNLRETEAPVYCRNTCLGCISCKVGLSDPAPLRSSFYRFLQMWIKCLEDLWPFRKYLQSFSHQPVNPMASHPKHRRAAMESYWTQTKGW